jgi:metal-sulfur cluster biosynthetic enzyme
VVKLGYQQKLVINQVERSKMSNITLTVGSQFTTSKSKVSGIIEEIVKNPSGSARVKLNVNGQPRWTTVK